MAGETNRDAPTRRAKGGETDPRTAPGAAETDGATTGREGRNRKAAASAKAVTVKAATPWGQAVVVEEIKVAQRAGDKRFSSVVQLLEDERGEALVRFAYTTDGVARRGPVTLRLKDVERLRAAVADASALG